MANRAVSDRNLSDSFVADFVKILEKHCKYIIVSGYVAISHGRSRGTEDVDVIIEMISREKFRRLHNNLIKGGFESIQNAGAETLYKDYLSDNTSIRYVKKGTLVPDLELKLAKDELDEYQLDKRVKLPLTNTDFFFSTPETNIAFKEEFLKSDKDLEDARHLRIVYGGQLDDAEIVKVKKMIRRLR
jgi:hypothetical protein